MLFLSSLSEQLYITYKAIEIIYYFSVISFLTILGRKGEQFNVLYEKLCRVCFHPVVCNVYPYAVEGAWTFCEVIGLTCKEVIEFFSQLIKMNYKNQMNYICSIPHLLYTKILFFYPLSVKNNRHQYICLYSQ